MTRPPGKKLNQQEKDEVVRMWRKNMEADAIAAVIGCGIATVRHHKPKSLKVRGRKAVMSRALNEKDPYKL